ncbi:MAG: TrmH family RNA methyltransferase [Bacteroidota bacterium]|nr:TrmH family RNA methyltransferase [Bacteroidota bacterium]MDP4232168.1 TrmH family RNA methyltransferase [Bacteroidota bacterium]MDP4241124.1 TrmH family RNA methyltransferase [Bacteroidota bacterium]MDP4286516.1 TrmH family RNA methyltransferase [Bacteroidota bacterium]
MPHITKSTYDEIQQHRLTEAAAQASTQRLPIIAILEDIRSLYNVGSIFRTSDGAHIEALYTVGYTPHPPRKEIDKTALGATRTVPHQHFATIQEAVASVRGVDHPPAPSYSASLHRRRSPKIAALEIASNSRSVFDLTPMDFPLAIIIGNEITGVSQEALALADFALEIPMLGAKHSLNVAVAYGVALFECVRVIQTVESPLSGR